MTTQELVGLIATGREHEFYTGSEWKKLAAKVRAYDRNECQHCKAAGRYARGEIVHHVKHLKERPDLALLCGGLIFAISAALTVCLGGMARSLLFTNLFFFLMYPPHHRQKSYMMI